jgi:hypothetical protein
MLSAVKITKAHSNRSALRKAGKRSADVSEIAAMFLRLCSVISNECFRRRGRGILLA